MDWRYPVHAEKGAAGDGRTQGRARRRALPLAEALSEVTQGDRRPLLVLRECLTCNGTDDALMTRQADNERTLLMMRWFQCVKLPPDVLEADHPYHALFGGEQPAHLFLSKWDGSGRADLSGQQSRTELWARMQERLVADYGGKVDSTLKQLLRTLDRFDELDARIQALKEELDEVVEEEGASRKLTRLQDQLVALEEQRNKARAAAVRLSELELKKARESRAPAEKSSTARDA